MGGRFSLAWGLCTALLVGAGAADASPARAYCRETVDSKPTGPCVETPGKPLLHWERGCMTYVFNDQAFSRIPLLTEAQVRDGFDKSFDAWRAVDCGDGPSPFYVEQNPGTTTTVRSEYRTDVPNESVFSARTREEWASYGHDDNALALTLLWHDKDTGEILDVDMELNTGAGRFTDCEKNLCGRDMMDLRNTITHEAGHLLGLGHSPIEGSTMLLDAPDGETEKRSLEKDDIDGYCSLGLPQFECTDAKCTCPAPTEHTGTRTVRTCACGVVGAQHAAPSALWLGGIGLFATFALRRRTRRRRK